MNLPSIIICIQMYVHHCHGPSQMVAGSTNVEVEIDSYLRFYLIV